MSSARMLRHVGTAQRYPASVSTITRVVTGRLPRSRGLFLVISQFAQHYFEFPSIDLIVDFGRRRKRLLHSKTIVPSSSTFCRSRSASRSGLRWWSSACLLL